MSTVSPGMRLHDRFILVERIGVGGMSQVWRATDEVLGRPVAVKMLSAELADPSLKEATWREARAAGRLTHPNVTRIYDYGEAELPDGIRAPYLVMELVEGQSLHQRLAAGPLGWAETARIGAQVAAALAAAHQIGVVHHDVKPGNVMLTPDGAKVLDFGIAALAGAGDREVLVGTPTYAAPERLRRAPAHPAQDVYSLGVVLHECLTGHPPARLADWSAAADAHRDGPPPAADLRLPDLPAPVAHLVTSCLSPDPAARPEARQVASGLARAAGVADPTTTVPAEEPAVATPLRYAIGSAPPVGPRTRIDHHPMAASPTRGRGRLMLAGLTVAAVVLALLTGLVIAALQGGPDHPAGAPQTPPPGSAGAPSNPDDGGPPEDLPGQAGFDVDAARKVVNDLDEAITQAENSGRIEPEAAEDLRDALRDIDKELTDPGYDREERIEKVREATEEFLEEIQDLREDGEGIHPSVENQLSRILERLPIRRN